MSERKIFFISLAAIILLVLVFASFSFWMSYAKISSKQLYSNQSAREYNSIVINNFDFDSLILGSSMSQGFKCSVFDAAYGGKSIKLTCSGSNFAEVKFFTDYTVRKKKIKRIMLDAPVTFLPWEQTLKDIPMEYYQDNMKILFFKKSFSINAVVNAFSDLKSKITGKTKYISRDDLYDWNLGRKCGEKYFAQRLLYDKRTEFNIDQKFAEKSKATVREFLYPMFNSCPETEFIVFYPPFSMMYYRLLDRREYIKLKAEITDMLLEMKNVRIFDFETAFHITENFENYRDTSHYSGKINSWMIGQMAQGNYQLTRDNKQQSFDKLLKRFEEYDFDKEYSRIEAKYGKK